MKNLSRSVRLFLILAAMGGFGAGAHAESVAEIEKNLAESFAKIQSGTAKTTTHQDLVLPTGEHIVSDSTAKVQWMRKGDSILFRSDMEAQQKQDGEGVAPIASKGKFTTVHDGEFHYVVSEEAGAKRAEKYKPSPAQYGDPHALFESLRVNYDMKVLSEEKLDGFDCYVLELIPKHPENGPTVRTKSYFRKDVGLNIKNIGYDKDGKEAFISATTDIEINVPLTPDRFTFKASPDFNVEDKTH
ncbi:MAG: hypothetical protein HY287_14160 [Planctomycetes bacterium]|nr:hypothetical protein [Planctomycetota bacterium]MBI3835467.1 hypothetical protein [Planctomycetota bacterium]